MSNDFKEDALVEGTSRNCKTVTKADRVAEKSSEIETIKTRLESGEWRHTKYDKTGKWELGADVPTRVHAVNKKKIDGDQTCFYNLHDERDEAHAV